MEWVWKEEALLLADGMNTGIVFVLTVQVEGSILAVAGGSEQ